MQGSLVRIYVDREFPGVLHEDRFIPEVRVREVIELQGVAVGSGSFIVSYVGSHWRDLEQARAEGSLLVQTGTGERHEAELVGVDQRISLALLRSPGLALLPVQFGPGLEEAGLALISVLGRDCRTVTPTVVHSRQNGLLPTRDLQVAAESALTESCAVEGGVVVRSGSGAVGILQRRKPHPFSATLRVWTVLPGEVVRESVERILQSGEDIRAGWLGIGLDQQKRHLRVFRVLPGSPAEQAGLLGGDRIVALGPHPVEHRSDLLGAVRWKGAGQRLELSVQRGDELLELSALLTERQDRDPVFSWRLKMPRLWKQSRSLPGQVTVERAVAPPEFRLGVLVEDRSGGGQDGTGGGPGLLVRSVVPGSPAAGVGIRTGDILLRLNGHRIASPAHLKESLETVADSVVLELLRNGEELTRRVTLR